jgi:hypothetical protein
MVQQQKAGHPQHSSLQPLVTNEAHWSPHKAKTICKGKPHPLNNPATTGRREQVIAAAILLGGVPWKQSRGLRKAARGK